MSVKQRHSSEGGTTVAGPHGGGIPLRVNRLFWGTLFLFVTSCHSLERAKQCRRIADVVNPEISAMDAHLATQPIGWAAVDQRLRSLEGSLSKVSVDDPKLKQVITEFSSNFALAREVAARGIESRNHGVSDSDVREQWRNARNRHGNLVKGFLRYCGP